MSDIFSVSNLIKAFGGLTAVNNVSFSLQKGEILGLIGPNGAGKTTIFNLMTGVLYPDSGEVIFQDIDISRKKPHEVVQLGVTRTFQGTKIFTKLTVKENVLTALHCQTNSGYWHSLFRTKKSRTERKDSLNKVESILEFLGIRIKADEIAGNLAYAHQSLVGIAVALATQPKILLLDEPLAGMNPQEADNMVHLIKEIRNQGISILLIEHNMRAVMRVCDRIIALNYGTVIAEGSPKKVQNDPIVIEAYLGRETIASA